MEVSKLGISPGVFVRGASHGIGPPPRSAIGEEDTESIGYFGRDFDSDCGSIAGCRIGLVGSSAIRSWVLIDAVCGVFAAQYFDGCFLCDIRLIRNIFHYQFNITPAVIQKEVTLLNRLGLHIRPAAQLTKIAAKYRSDVYLLKDGMRVNGKSIMGVMMLAAARGSTLVLECIGDDEQQLLDELVILFENKFYEE